MPDNKLTDNEIKQAAEAYKECIEKVKKELEKMCLAEDAYVPYPFIFLDNLLKELVGDNQ